jgi:hypothetical protein
MPLSSVSATVWKKGLSSQRRGWAFPSYSPQPGILARDSSTSPLQMLLGGWGFQQ